MTTYTDQVLAENGLEREVTLAVFGFAALAGLIRNTDIITTLPKRLGDGVFSQFATAPCRLKKNRCTCFFLGKK